MNSDLIRIRKIADYQFGQNTGEILFPENVKFEYSRKTGKIRFIYSEDILLAALRPTDGNFTLTIAGAERLISSDLSLEFTVKIIDEVAEFIADGKNVMAKHVNDAGENIRPGDEVIIVNSNNQVLGVGKSLFNRKEMLSFKVGAAVRTRRGKNKNR